MSLFPCYERVNARLNLFCALGYDRDVWETSWYQQLCGSVTFHAFETPPTKVYVVFRFGLIASELNSVDDGRLDLGCGTGAWVLECAQRWKVRSGIFPITN